MTPRLGTFAGAAALLLAGAAAWSPIAALAAEPTAVLLSNAAQKGVEIDFSAAPVAKAGDGEGAAVEEYDVSFKVRDAATRQPLVKRRPGAWIDAGAAPLGAPTGGCKERVENYLGSASTGARPIVDLTSYYILAFNRDASLSIIDPLVGMAGRTNLLATIALSGPPGDWTTSPDGKRIYVTLPSADKVAVIDAESFKLVEEIAAGRRPLRIALSPDSRSLWIANDADDDEAGGLTAIDVAASRIAAHFSTGRGHHEIAVSPDGRHVYATNREKGDVAIVDARALKVVDRLGTGSTPISLAYSDLAQAVYVADGVDGTVTVIDGASPRILARIAARPGLGPTAITPDGHWALVANAKENLVHVIEIATNRHVQDIPAGARPYQLSFSDAFAYVVSLDSEIVGMISLENLGKATARQISSFAAGATPPAKAPDLGVGASVARAVDEAAVVVANPADNMIYYYMEGMLAPSGSFRNPGREVRSVGVLDRGLKETAPGVYSARVRLPAGAVYEAAIMLDSPRAVDCFPLQVARSAAPPQAPFAVDYLAAPAISRANDPVLWRFKFARREKGGAVSDVSVLAFAPGASARRLEISAREVEAGVFEARLTDLAAGAYYVYVAAPSRGLQYGDAPPRNLLVRPPE